MQLLKSWMARQEITQVELARRLGVSQPTVWEWLNGHSRPSLDNLLALASETGITVDELARDLPPKAA
jgi:transcriptional regulator with XRE-family HTH domain